MLAAATILSFILQDPFEPRRRSGDNDRSGNDKATHENPASPIVTAARHYENFSHRGKADDG